MATTTVLDEATEALVRYVQSRPWAQDMAADVLRVAADRLRARADMDHLSAGAYRHAADLLTEGIDGDELERG